MKRRPPALVLQILAVVTGVGAALVGVHLMLGLGAALTMGGLALAAAGLLVDADAEDRP